MTNIQKSNNKPTPVNDMKSLLSNRGMQELFINTLEDNANTFMASLIDVYSSDKYLAKCDPKDVAMEALKAATLKLPINKELGFAYLVAYKNEPTMIIGYKGYIQLAMRTGQYQNLNSGIIYEGMEVKENILTGEVEIQGEKESNKAIGYFAYFKLINGFEKVLYMTKEEVIDHGQRFSPSYSYGGSTWQTNFDSMALKTVTRKLISKYGPMSVEMEKAQMMDTDGEVRAEIDAGANKEMLGVQIVDPETGEILEDGQGLIYEDEETPKNEGKAPF